MELIAVAASVIGGIRMTGGYGTIVGAVPGTFLLQMLDQGLVLWEYLFRFFKLLSADHYHFCDQQYLSG